MPTEKFKNKTISQRLQEKRFRALREQFEKLLPAALRNVLFEYKPNLKNNIFLFDSEIAYICKECTNSVWENLNLIWQIDSKPGQNTMPVDKKEPVTKEFWDKKLLKKKKQFAEEYHEKLEKEHWEQFDKMKLHEKFTNAIFETLKKVIAQICLEEIQDLEGNSLRYLSYCIKNNCATTFVKNIEELR